MTIKEIVSEITLQEGKKHQASVGDVREIVGIISDMIFGGRGIMIALCDNGYKRAKKNVSKSKKKK